MSLLIRLGLLSLIAFAGLVAASRAAAEDEPLLDFREITLDNGLRVITLEDFSCPKVNVQLWYHVGSKDEDPERQGFAHMFEHMMFRGTDVLGPTDHFDYIRRTGGSSNAYTSFDQTVYHESVPADQLELALWLEAQRMAFLKIDQDAFDTERKVVEEERRMGLNRPYGSLYEQVLAKLYQEHPYQWTPIGKIPHLRSSEVRELRDFWNRYYVPNNATLVVAGAVKHGEAQQLARRHFGWIPRGEAPPRVTVEEPVANEARSITIEEENAPVPLVAVIARMTPLAHDDYIPLRLLTTILVGDDSSRLYRDLVVDKKLAVQTMDIAQGLEQDGLLVIGAVLAPFGAQPDAALEAIQAQIEKLREGEFSDDELLKARNNLLKETVVETLTVEGKAQALGSAAVLEGDASRVNHRLAAIRDVTREDLKRVANEYLAPERLMSITVKRAEGDDSKQREEDAPITAQPERDAPPPGRPGLNRPSPALAAAPLRVGSHPKPEFEFSEHTLPGGLKVIVVPNHEVPFVSVQLGLLAGAWSEDKPGVASMALRMLDQGTQRHDEAALAAELGKYAINLYGSAGRDSSSVVVTSLTEYLPRAVGLLADVVLTPTFPEEQFDKKIRELRTELLQMEGQQQHLAQRELRRRLFGDHPYGRTTTGNSEDVDNLELNDLAAWWHKYARPDMATLIFAGDVTDEEALSLARSAFGSWQAEGPQPGVDLPEIAAPEKMHIYLVDDPGATQSQILVGELGITRHHEDHPTSRVVSSYFGGAFNSRLNETIRVKKGLTYGARGGFQADRFAGLFTISTFTKTESTVETIEAVFDELARLQNEAPSEKEIETTRLYALGSYALDRETPQQVAGDLWTLEENGLPASYFDDLLSGIAAATPDDCLRVVNDLVDPERVVVVVVGDAKALEGELEKLGPVTVVESPKKR